MGLFLISTASVVVFVALMNPSAAALSSPASRFTKFPNRKVVLVTGSNKGIGYEIAKKLLSHKGDEKASGGGFDFVCVLGCRNEELGRAAARNLAKETKNPAVDVVAIDLRNRHESITAAASYLRETYGRCDVLINNAAVCYNDPTLYGKVPHTPFSEQAEITVDTNFFGTLALIRALLPLMLNSQQPQGKESDGTETSTSTITPRIINIASSAGRLSIIPSEDKRKELSSESLTLEDLEAYMKDFVRAAKEGTHAVEGWPNTGYGVSKVGIIAMTKILARKYQGNDVDFDVNVNNSDDLLGPRGRIMVNSVDPGYCATDQNNNQGVIPAERGAVTPYLLATLTESEETKGFFTGRHWYQEREIEW